LDLKMTSQTSSRYLLAAQRRREAVRLRLLNWPLRRISDHLGVSMARVHGLLVEALQAAREETSTLAGELLLREIRSANEALYAVFPGALTGSPAALEKFVQLLNRRDRLAGPGGPPDDPPAGAAPGQDDPDDQPGPSVADCRRAMEEHRHYFPYGDDGDDDLATAGPAWPGPGADQGPSEDERQLAAEVLRKFRAEHGLTGDKSLAPAVTDVDDHD
jgi:hypothetical protein